MKKLITICLICVLSIASTVLADDIMSPQWRGQSGTVTAQWNSWIGFGYEMYPDSWGSNPGVSFTPNAYAYSGASFLSEFNGRTNIIELTGDHQIDFAMPNFDTQNPFKEVQIQVTYYAVSGFQWSSVSAWADMAEISEPAFITENSYGNGWYTDVWDLTIQPNPSWELIYVNFTNGLSGTEPLYPAYIDQVVIDTICPEPATIAFLAAGALLLGRKKK